MTNILYLFIFSLLSVDCVLTTESLSHVACGKTEEN